MRNKNFWNFIVNPFTRIAGWQAFGPGIAVAITTAIIGTLSHTAMDGVLDTHYVLHITYGQSFLMLAINIVTVTIIMSLATMFVSKGFRFIDILGTMTFARAPYLIMALLGFTVSPEAISNTLENLASGKFPLSIIFTGIISVPVIIWVVALMYNGIKVSCNINGTKLVVTFITGLIAAEIASKILIIRLLPLLG